MAAFTSIAAGVTAAAAATGAASQAGAFGGGGGGESGFSLPPEYELQLLEQFKSQQAGMQQDIIKYQGIVDAYDQKMETLDGMIKGSMPTEQGLKELTASSLNLAVHMGQSSEELVKNGFLDARDKEQLDKLYGISGDPYSKANPVVEGQIQGQKRQLEQDLARAGVSPAQRQIALSQFEQSANAQRLTANQVQFGMLQQALGASGVAKLQNFQIVQQGYADVTGLQSQFSSQRGQGLTALNQIAGNRLAAGQQGLAASQGYRQEGMQSYQDLGKFKLSGQTKDAIQSGLVGPGTMYQQTGVARNEQDSYKNFIKGQEEFSTQFAGGTPQYGVDSYQNWISRNSPKPKKDYAVNPNFKPGFVRTRGA